MDLLYEAASAWQELTACTYRITYGKSGVLHTITLKFDGSEFCHLAGFQYMNDIVLPFRFSHAKAIEAVLTGRITEAHISKGDNYKAIKERLTAITKLKKAMDASFQIYKEPLNKSPAADDGSFPPILRFEKWEIHKVFRHFSNLVLTKNLSPSTAADLIRASINSIRRFCPFIQK